MTTIVEGMTPAEFIAAINNNFSELDTYAYLTTISTVSVEQTSGQLKTTIDANNAEFIPLASKSITALPVTIGMTGTSLISNLNTNFVALSNDFSDLNVPVQSNSIYVSNAGSDSTGTGTIGNPYATLSKVTIVLQNSTKVYLAKGSTFINDKLDLSGKTNIVVDSYGSGTAPILEGKKLVTGWTDLGSNIWSKQDANFPAEITNVFKSGVRCTLGKTANKTATGGSTTTLEDTGLTGDYSGAEIYINHYVWQHSIVRATLSGTTFTFPEVIYAVAAGNTYFIQNHLSCIDAQDEWAFNNVTKTLYMYSVGEPANITVTYGDDLIYGDSCNWITIQNLTINDSCQCGIKLTNTFKIDINNVAVNYAGIYSISAYVCGNVNIHDNTTSYQNADGIIVMSSGVISITDNVVYKAGENHGSERYLAYPYGYNGFNTNGIVVGHSDSMTIQYNTVSYTSYNGIFLGYCTDVQVDHNYSHHTNNLHTDGGNIYISNSENGVVEYNIFTHGNLTNELSHGIYFDEHSLDFEINNNFVAVSHYSFYSLVCSELNIHDNTFYVTYYGGVRINDTVGACEHIVNNNLLVHSANTAYNLFMAASDSLVETITNNKYFHPFGKRTDDKTFRAAAEMTFDEWLADETRVDWGRAGEEEITPSVYSGSAKPTLNFLIYLINPSKNVRVVTEAELPYNDYVDMDGDAQTYPFNMPAYTGKILVRPN